MCLGKSGRRMFFISDTLLTDFWQVPPSGLGDAEGFGRRQKSSKKKGFRHISPTKKGDERSIVFENTTHGKTFEI